MNKATAITFLITGLLLFMGSCVPVGYIIYFEAVIDPSESISLSDIGSLDKATFHADPGTLARFGIQAEITTTSIQEYSDSLDDEYLARFKFPIRYTISNTSGNVLISEDITLAWKNGHSISKRNENTTSISGTLTASTDLKKFTVPADGNINIEIMISPDMTYEASYASSQLHFYKGMIDNTWYLVSGFSMFFIGIILTLIGFIYVVTSVAMNTKNESAHTQHTVYDTTDGGSPRDKEINQNAMIIQLSAFAGYIIPLGSIILPLILWLVWRDKDPYIDKMGCEAVNFQLSMLIYYIISFVLMFILIGFVLIFATMIFHLVFIIIGAVQTSNGNDYRYPMIIRFIKA